MSPLWKVSLIEDTCERLDEDSGPYSMLFLESRSSKNNVKKDIKKTVDKLNDTIKICTENLACDKTCINNPTDGKEIFNTDNQTFVSSPTKNVNIQDATYELENTLKRKTFNADHKEYFGTAKCNTFCVDPATVNSNEKQNTFKVNYTYNKDEVNAQNPDETFINRSCETSINETNFGAKRRKINNQLHSESLVLTHTSDEKVVSLPTSFDYPYSSTPSKTNVNFEFKNLRLSNINAETVINSEDEKSKRDSLDCEESWGILTPDQMIDDYVSHLKVGFELACEQENTDKCVEPERNSSPNDYSLGLLDEKLISNVTRRYSTITKLLSEDSRNSSPKDYSLGLLDETLVNNVTSRHKIHEDTVLKFKLPNEIKEPDIQSPNVVDASVTEYSLGILDEHMISNISIAPDTMNLALPLENVTESKDYRLSRIEQTPSPEDLPLDPTPVVIQEDLKEENKSKPPNSFITSITSITSLDTGYQGDGEMSRPASRGADNSPITRRPLIKPHNHRQDPMTDSDFYTESDADNHEEQHLKGDRKAQVIDGTLYGVDAQATADIYTNNRENMDSSGIFTDVETNTRAEDLNETFDVSPSDTSTKTISENSQDNLQVQSPKTNVTPVKEVTKKRVASSPVSSIPTNIQSPKSANKNDNTLVKKYKMPKRDVASKVKAMLVPNQSPVPSEKKTVKKPVGRWDNVMSKISKNEQNNKNNLKEVKSKVFKVTVSPSPNNKTIETNKINVRQSPNQKTPNSKLKDVKPKVYDARTIIKLKHNEPITKPINPITPKSYLNPTNSSLMHEKFKKAKIEVRHTKKSVELIRINQPDAYKKINSTLRRTRTRNLNTVNSVRNTLNLESSLSDVSSAAQQLSKKNSEKKKLISSPNDVNTKKYTSPRDKEKKSTESTKISDNRNNVKPGRQIIVGPSKRNQTNFKEDHRIVEALAILVQHLVFNVEAFSVPTLKREIRGRHLENEEWKKSYKKLEDSIREEKARHLEALEQQNKLHKEATDKLIESYKNQILQLQEKEDELQEKLVTEKDNFTKQIKDQHEEQLSALKSQFSKLQANYEERLDILREENDAIREQIDEKKLEAQKIKKDYDLRECQLKDKVHIINIENQKLIEQTKILEHEIIKKTEAVREENEKLREENDRLLSYGDEKGIGLQEVQSLRAVLELKQTEVSELRKALAEATQRLDILELAEERANTLNAKCEDLQSQLLRKQEYEQSLINENSKLHESFKEENKKNARLNQHNEELQWKLKQNKEVIGHILDQTAGDQSFNRSMLNSSFNEKHSSTRQHLERSLSFRDHSFSSSEGNKSRRYKSSHDFDEDDSPPSSPKVKGVVEKSDSVSYVLDLDESPDIVASRIVRRSFRNSTPPKTTPTKSPTNKTPKNSLSLSSSTSSMTGSKSESKASNKNDEFSEFSVKTTNFAWSTPRFVLNNGSSYKLDDDNSDNEDDDISLPALPSEINRQHSAQALPTPKHLAGEAISESASEDESTSSSQL